jgi:multiple sugar transport system permease protein
MTIDTRTVPQSTDVGVLEGEIAVSPRVRRRRPAKEVDVMPRGIVSASDWRAPGVRRTMRTLQILLLLALIVWGIGPLLWLAKASVSPTQQLIADPVSWWPSTTAWHNISDAWTQLDLGLYFKNTVVLAFGSWFAQIFIAATGGYALSVLKPAYGKIVYALVLATLFIPSVVILVPLFATVLNLPLVHWDLGQSYWAIWLPAGANAFNVVLMKRFFDNLPREIFEAARVDGAGPFRLFWNIVLPMSKPILGVVSVFAFIASWKDFLWPFLILGETQERQPLNVRLPALAQYTDKGELLAALFLSTLLPIIVLAVFQRVFLRNQGLGGAIKG